MNKVLVVGTSHSACLKEAWDARETRWAGQDVTFFAIMGREFKKLSVQDDLTFGPTSPKNDALRESLITLNGAAEVNFRDYDVIVRTGFDLGEGLYRTLLSRFDVDGIIEGGKSGRRISQDFFETALRANFEDTVVQSDWADWGADAPKLMIVPKPAFSERVIDQPLAQTTPWKRYLTLGDGVRQAREVFDKIMVQAFSEKGAVFLPRPEVALTALGLSKSEFSVGSSRLGESRGDHPEGEFRHMNAAYGALVLDQVFAELGASA